MRIGKTIAIRGDIDALPISEENNLPFSSQIDGVFHACEHDIHTTYLLFCARILQENRDKLVGIDIDR